MVKSIDNWQDYYDLLQRAGLRAKKAVKSSLGEVSDEDIQDLLYYYLITCWHFKDWLISSGIDKTTTNNFVNDRTGYLSVVGDVVDSYKHFSLNSNMRRHRRLRIEPTEVAFFDRKTGTSKPFRVIMIISKDSSDDIIFIDDFIDLTLREWADFLEDHINELAISVNFSDQILPRI